MLDRRSSIWLIGAGVLFFHGILVFLLARQRVRPLSPSAENPVLVTLVPPPPPKKQAKPVTVEEPIISKKNKAPKEPQITKNTVPHQNVQAQPPKTRLQAETVPAVNAKPPDGPWVVFAPQGSQSTHPNPALRSLLQSLACANHDRQSDKQDCPQGQTNLMPGLGDEDELKRIAKAAEKALYLAAGSPKLRPKEDVSLINRDPMASVNLIGGSVFDLEAAKELENLHKYKDPVFGD